MNGEGFLTAETAHGDCFVESPRFRVNAHPVFPVRFLP